MRNLILRVVVNGLALWAAAYFVNGITLTDDVGQVALVALIFGLVNAVLKPILMLVSFPFLIATLGLFALVVNAAMLMITARIMDGFAVDGWGAAIFGSIVVSLVTMLLGGLKDDKD
ncbi:MAG: phage holin family protein [Gemmatimonadetes bacterium]|nr:phage holin family protein [Gemmatimonadota bacterium]MBT8404982.1 phage holin family protein [Gemmatimonadota bacterium]NNK63394.1 phage holin family protein [Gemmatimonadota bacterium]